MGAGHKGRLESDGWANRPRYSVSPKGASSRVSRRQKSCRGAVDGEKPRERAHQNVGFSRDLSGIPTSARSLFPENDWLVGMGLRYNGSTCPQANTSGKIVPTMTCSPLVTCSSIRPFRRSPANRLHARRFASESERAIIRGRTCAERSVRSVSADGGTAASRRIGSADRRLGASLVGRSGAHRSARRSPPFGRGGRIGDPPQNDSPTTIPSA